MKYWILTFFCIFFTAGSITHAQTSSYKLEAYRNIVRVPSIQITEPTVTQITFPATSEYNSIIVVENESQTPQPLATRIEKADATIFTVSAPYGTSTSLTDNLPGTYVDFPISENGSNE